MKYILALDQGTTSSRAIVFDERALARSSAQREYPQIYPQPGWVEHDPEQIWRSQLACARQAIAKARIRPSDVRAIGIANQRETTIVWDRSTGDPIYPGIVWQDRRTANACERLQAQGWTERVRAKTGLVIDPYFSATKLAWILDNVPEARSRAEAGELAFGTVDTWLVWKLSGGALHVTDATNASRTMLYNIHTRRWDEELLDQFGVPAALLPEVRGSSEVYGHCKRSVLGAEIPIAGMAGDQQAALFGQGCHLPGMAKNTYGTGCFLLLNTGERAYTSREGLLTTAAATRSGSQYVLEGSVFIAGAVVQWLRDGLGILKKSADVEKLAASVPDSGGVYFVPAFAGLGAPHWDPYARGTIVGLTRGSTSAHLARAALESIAFQSAEILLAMQRDTGISLTEMRVDGGASVNNLLLQFQADLLGVPVVRSRTPETSALGAAYLAGLATGLWHTLGAVREQWQQESRFEPTMARDTATERMAEWSRSLARARDWAGHT